MLGWRSLQANPTYRKSTVNGRALHSLTAVAEQMGMLAVLLNASARHGPHLPARAVLLKIEQRSRRNSLYEHLIVYSSMRRRPDKLWQWVRRQPGRKDPQLPVPSTLTAKDRRESRFARS